MTYTILKAAHLILVMVWLAGLLAAPVALLVLRQVERPGPAAAVLKSWYTRMVSPAMFGVWLLGLGLMLSGQWFRAPWMWAKLTLVLALTGLYGVLMGLFKRLAQDPDAALAARATIRGLLIAVFVVMVVVVGLVVIKPF